MTVASVWRGREQRTGLLPLLESGWWGVVLENQGQEETGGVTHMVIYVAQGFLERRTSWVRGKWGHLVLLHTADSVFMQMRNEEKIY